MSNSIEQIGQLVPGVTDRLDDSRRITENGDGESFADLFRNIIESVNGLQMDAGRAQELMAAGEAADLHQVMIAVEEAGLSMDLLLEIRNRLVEAYQTFMRMPM